MGKARTIVTGLIALSSRLRSSSYALRIGRRPKSTAIGIECGLE